MNTSRIQASIFLRKVRQLAGGMKRLFTPDPDPYRVPWAGKSSVSDAALIAATRNRPASVMLHGVMPRSGTVYVGELLRKHPALYAYPNEMWEIPFLELAAQIRSLQHTFYRGYTHNQQRMQDGDFLPIFGSAFLDYLYAHVPHEDQTKRLLLKEAGVKFLAAFPDVFPAENLLLLLRDGRDLVHSTMKTWPSTNFSECCREWAASTRAALDYYEQQKHVNPPCWLVKYEDVQSDPAAFVRGACERFGLDPAAYPFSEIADVRLIGSSTLSQAGSVDWSKHEKAPQDFRPVGHWAKWPNQWTVTFKRLAGAVLVDAGYAKGLDW